MKRIVCVADTHVGHVCGLWHPNAVDKYGRPLVMSEGQRWLYDRWQEFQSRMKKIDVLLFLGDHVEGVGARTSVKEFMTTDVDIQISTAVELFKPIVEKAKEVFMISGSDYHCSIYEDFDKRISNELGISWMPDEPQDFMVEDVVISIRHGKGGPLWYRATKMDKELIANLMAAACDVAHKANLILRAHYHFYGWLEYLTQMIVAVPCWQLQTPYMKKHSADKFFPDIGAVIIDVDKNIIINQTKKLQIVWSHPRRALISLKNPSTPWELW
jgi:hypothetical protein